MADVIFSELASELDRGDDMATTETVDPGTTAGERVLPARVRNAPAPTADALDGDVLDVGAAAAAAGGRAGPHVARRRARSLLDHIMASPLTGLSPWILYAIVEGPGRLELSAALAFALAAAVVSINWIRGDSPKMLEFSDVTYFATLAVVVAFASTGTRHWLELWGGEVANIALLVIALGSILIRRPFTLAYAKDDVDEQYWDTPEFLGTNYRIAWAWVLAFGIAAASGFYGDAALGNSNNIWTGWIIQTLPMLIAAQFTIWYPNRLQALREGRIESAPTVRDFLGTVTPWMITVGIIALSVGGTPETISIGLIVVGIVSTRLLTARSGAAVEHPDAV